MSEHTLMYDDYLRKVAARFENRFADIEAEWGFDYGVEFEITLCRLLRQVLPQRYGICRGFVVTRDGQKKGDDIIIFDRDSFSTLRLVEQDGFERKESIPVEAVYAYLEAKHTLCIEGDEGQSLQKACEQVAAVKPLPREDVPWTFQDPYVFNPSHRARVPKYWPPVRNQIFSGIIARHVRLKKSTGEHLTKPDEITTALSAANLGSSYQPDLIVAGRDVVCLPTIDHGFHSPFLIEGQSHLSSRQIPGLAFGVGICSLLHAIDMMRLNTMPWPLMIADAVGLRLVTEDKRGSIEFTLTFPCFTIINDERKAFALVKNGDINLFPIFTTSEKASEYIAKARYDDTEVKTISDVQSLQDLAGLSARHTIDNVVIDPISGSEKFKSIHVIHLLEDLRKAIPEKIGSEQQPKGSEA